ncbi:hypothetical protein Ddye_029910, partial [Dipteronia dyeriana]
ALIIWGLGSRPSRLTRRFTLAAASKPLTPTGRPTSTASVKPLKPSRSSTLTSRATMPSTKPTHSVTRPTFSVTKPSVSITKTTVPVNRTIIYAAKTTVPSWSSTPTRSTARSSTPTSRPSITSSKPTSKASTPTRRSSTPSSAPSIFAPPVKSPRWQSCSPSRGRAPIGTTHSSGSSVPTVNLGYSKVNDNVNPVVIGTKMVERVINMQKLALPSPDGPGGKSSSPDSLGFEKTLSKKSLDMAVRHMDIRRNIHDSPLATSSNASSELSVNNNGLCIEIEDDIGYERGDRSPASMRGMLVAK